MNKRHKRAVKIASMNALGKTERKTIRAAFALLFWNDKGFSPSAFKAACDAAEKDVDRIDEEFAEG